MRGGGLTSFLNPQSRRKPPRSITARMPPGLPGEREYREAEKSSPPKILKKLEKETQLGTIMQKAKKKETI